MWTLPNTQPEPRATDALDYWHALQSRQSDWAFRAYDRLISTLSTDVQEKLRNKGRAAEPYVVIFGKTQVGKTTLLLDLMGVTIEHMPAVSKVLRGGQQQGRSATATVTEYCRSQDDCWRLSVDSACEEFATDKAMTQCLGQLRKAMIEARLHAKSPCVVHIPRRFFAAAQAARPGVRMLDLPGDNPANEAEQHHVSDVARRYIPFADLVILVGRGDDLGFLRPGGIGLPGIADWQKMPHRFRVVTTYSYTAQSVRDLLRKDARVGELQLRERLVQEIARFGALSDAAKDTRLYFPLEFGASWMNVRQDDPVLDARMAPIIRSLRGQLLDQIASSTSPIGRLRSTLNTHISIKAINDEKCGRLTQFITDLKANVCGISAQASAFEQQLASARAKVEALEHLLHADLARARKGLIVKSKQHPVFTSGGQPQVRQIESTKDVPALKTLAVKCCHTLRTMRLQPATAGCGPATYWNKVKQYLEEPDLAATTQLVDDAFRGIRSTLDDYWFDTYLSSANYAKDRSSVLASAQNAQASVLESFEEAWLKAMTQVDKELRDRLASARGEAQAFAEESTRCKKRLQALQRETARHERELATSVADSAQDLERCDRFVDFLNKEYLATLDHKLSTALSTDDDCEALLQVFSCEALRRQHEELLNVNETNGDTRNAVAS